jgi:hypothetical protein
MGSNIYLIGAGILALILVGYLLYLYRQRRGDIKTAVKAEVANLLAHGAFTNDIELEGGKRVKLEGRVSILEGKTTKKGGG